jgi:hypothetical protein
LDFGFRRSDDSPPVFFVIPEKAGIKKFSKEQAYESGLHILILSIFCFVGADVFLEEEKANDKRETSAQGCIEA